MPKSKRPKKSNDLPSDLKQEITNNGHAMEQFYLIPTDQREDVLDKISETNEKLEKIDE